MRRLQPLRSVLLSLSLGLPIAGAVFLAPDIAWADGTDLRGVVVDEKGNAIEGVNVVINSDAISEQQDTVTNERGIFRFPDLPPGIYTIEYFYSGKLVEGQFTVNRGQAVLRQDVTFRGADGDTVIVNVKTERGDDKTRPDSGEEFTISEVEDIPTGSRDDVLSTVELQPNTERTANGVRIGAGQAPETDIRLDGLSVSNVSSGTSPPPIVNEFVASLEVLDAGYDPEYGRTSSGLVQGRRAGGSNVHRGSVRFSFAPRLAPPRFITTTDEALRVQQVPQYQASGAFFMSGPLIKDRLFYSVGLAPQTTRYKLIQSFYNRVDLDGSGGFEPCPNENGDKDCRAGTNYIATDKFAEQSFDTGTTNLQYQVVLDWNITSKHRLRLAGGGGPGFDRRSFRQPFSFDPSAFGTNPSSDPLSGASRIAQGVVNDHFGTDFNNFNAVGLEYVGRFAQDKLEVEASVGYTRSRRIDAWRLDNPSLRDIPATQYQTTVPGGANLFEFLDRDQATDLVAGVQEACNDAEIPGVACPIRVWRSGGIGQTSDITGQQIAGNLHFTHFIPKNILKYGVQVQHVRQRNRFRYSGSNTSELFEDCPAGTVDHGEFCWDPGQQEYIFNTSQQVDNHRFLIVNVSNPESVTTLGYGRPRYEQGSLRTVAEPNGDGARVPAYDAKLSTENYAAFVQDRWAILPNLYLSGGVRWEVQDMRSALGERALTIWDNVAPRVGISYDWTQEGKSRLFASYGHFYQNLPLALSNRVFGGLSTIRRSYRRVDCQGQRTNYLGDSYEREVDGQPTQWCTDGNVQTTGLVEGLVVPDLKGMFNRQWQIGYEQEIFEDLTLQFRWLHTGLGRTVEDVSTDGGNNYVIANPGVGVSEDDIAAQQSQCDALASEYDELTQMGQTDDSFEVARQLQRCLAAVDAYTDVNELFSRPQRTYDAFTFRLQKRFARNWILFATYTYSRLIGNYDGFVDPITGAVNLGASRQFDTPELVRNSWGPLSNNRPHRASINGSYTIDLKKAGALTVGGSAFLNSGYPVSVRADSFSFPSEFGIYLVPRGAAGQVELNYQINGTLAYAILLPRDLELNIEARLLNLTNAKAALRVDEVYSFAATRPIAGGDLSDLKHAKIQGTSDPLSFYDRTILPRQGNFGTETTFQNPMSGQFSVTLRF